MLEYWIWLSLCLDNGSAHLIPLLNRFADPKRIYKTPIKDLESSFLTSSKEIKRFKEYMSKNK